MSSFNSYITTGTIALSKAVVPINTGSSGISRKLDKTSPTHATRYQSTPIKLKCNSIAIVRLKLNVVTLGL